MSTQTDGGFSFSIRPEERQQQIRLLELPPELLSQLTADNPPTLQFKSAGGPPGQPQDSTAVLCTRDQTFTIRQVNHSNSVYIAQTIFDSPEHEIPNPQLEAVAATGFVLELLPCQPGSAAPFIKKALPIWTSGNTAQSQGFPLTKQHLFANIPLSDTECQRSWTDLACFEINEQCYLPSAALQVEGWKHIINTILAEGIDPLAPLTYTSKDTIRAAAEETTELSSQVVDAVLAAVSDPIIDSLDHDKCLNFVGLNLLTSQRRTPLDRFLTEWKDLVPEKWRADVRLSIVSSSYTLSEDGKTVILKDSSTTTSTSADGSNASASSSSTAAKRKWHEKFRPSKKAS